MRLLVGVQSWSDRKALQISEDGPCINWVTVLPHLETIAIPASHAAIGVCGP